jgi:hypothetical protein
MEKRTYYIELERIFGKVPECPRRGHSGTFPISSGISAIFDVDKHDPIILLNIDREREIV